MTREVPYLFGEEMAWLALRASSPRAVADALRMAQCVTVGWTDGLDAIFGADPTKDAPGGTAFLTPAMSGWVLCCGWVVLEESEPSRGDPSGARVPRRIVRLSRRFGEAHAYWESSGMGAYGWMRARAGRLERAYEHHDAEALLDLGRPTPVEEEDHPWVGVTACYDVGHLAHEWSAVPDRPDDTDWPPGHGLVGVIPPDWDR